MNRKDFIGASGLLLAGSTLPSWKSAPSDDSLIYRRPPYLKAGDTIGITAPAGFITSEELKPAVALMESWGFKIRYGNTIDKKDNSFGGTDEERLLDFQQLLDDPTIKAIMCARGGYGSVRIVDRIKWEKFKLHPKWVIGFSDITVLHGHIHTNCQVATLHSKMTNSFPDDWSKAEPIQIETIESIRDALTGKKMTYTANLHERNRMGYGTGPLIGGNLKTIETLAGSASDIRTAGKLLFVEDVGEYLYSIDRMFWNLQRTGKLKSLKGLIVGGFRVKPDDPGEEFGKTVQDIVMEKVKDFSYPVCFDFPVGHQKANFALKCGITHKLTVSSTQILLSELI
jgi:muramoyltetrapeptide carboxypeptidase